MSKMTGKQCHGHGKSGECPDHSRIAHRIGFEALLASPGPHHTVSGVAANRRNCSAQCAWFCPDHGIPQMCATLTCSGRVC